MDCCVRVFYGGIVRKEDGMFEGMDEEVEWFDKPPSFDDLCGRLHDLAVIRMTPTTTVCP
jgi:hypothetical protein